MRCKRCRKSIAEGTTRCPHCGELNPDDSGLYQTSTVLISSGGKDRVYRSVEEVPARLRTKLLKSTNGSNSATILIADRRGRKEIARAMRHLPTPAQRRLVRSVLGSEGAPGAGTWLTPLRKKIIVAIVAVMMAAFLALVYLHTWL
jgi:phage FluMu protein Com